ncbi:choice-of-anchor D domain-containing protein [Cystobacter fuscus]|nr:choice-of-anchor D domain-containing protein [Cystobacter fuscus]
MLGRRGSCLATCLFAVLVAGCERPSSQRASSHLGLTPGKLEFGLSAVGITRTKTVRLSNQGRAPLLVRGVSATLPDVRVEPFEPFELPSGGEREVEVRFTPGVEGTVEGRLEVLTDADNVGREGVASLGVGGQGVKASLEVLVRTLDFGDVETGHLEVRELVVRNASLVDSPVRLSLSGLDADAFGSDAVGAPFSLQPGAQRRLSLSFLPERLGAAEAEAHVGVECFGCEPSVVKLSGTGIASRLEVTPLRVDFGRVAVGSTAEERVTVRNLGTEPLAYGGVRLLEGSGGDFHLVSAPTLPGEVLAPGARVEVRVSFSPTTRGAVPSALLEVDARPLGSTRPGPKVSLVGEGGSGCVELQPRLLAFGAVPEGMSATRDVRVINRCREDVLVGEQKITPGKGGYFLLAQAPASLPVPAGQSLVLPITFMPRAGAGAGEAELSVKLLEGRGTSTEKVRLVGEGRMFPPCQYALAPEEVAFGQVPPGSEVTLGVGLTNVGSTECFVAGMRLVEGSDAAFSGEPVPPHVLAPGERALLRVRFAPESAEVFSGLAEAWVHHPSRGHVRVPLRGEGARGCFSVQPTQLDFGALRLSCGPREREVVLHNDCAGPTRLVGLGLVGDASDFQVTGGPSVPGELAPGSRTPLKVTYAPRGDGEDIAALRFELATGAPVPVGLGGRGLLRDEQTDMFTQSARNAVDVLFVVDNSVSMMDEQRGLGQNFAAFLSHAAASDVDYHIAVTTTGLTRSLEMGALCPGGADGGEYGRFFPVDGASPRIITPATPQAGSVFAHNTHVGVCHWNEQGLEAMYRALSEPLVHAVDDPTTPLPRDGNAGFLREHARLAIIAVTDEEDFSPRDVGFYETFLLGLKGNDRSQVVFSAIAGPEDLDSCPSASGTGSRYLALARATGGVVESICTPNWSESLARLSESTFEAQRSFPLSESPSDAAKLRVRVGGVAVSEGWTYDTRSRAVVFSQAPAPGATVEITYPVGCQGPTR